MNQEIFDFDVSAKLDWNDFIESDENRDALLYLTKWPNWPSNGLIINGAAGVGKTHLAALWAQSANAVYVLSESLRFDPRDLFVNDCNFVFDNFENFLSNQPWLFHFYNIAKEKKRFFLILDRVSPQLWNISLNDLRSRLLQLPTVTIKNHGEELLRKVIKKISADLDLPISDDAIDYILQISERSIPNLTCILKTLDKLALKEKKSLSLSFVKRYLKKDE